MAFADVILSSHYCGSVSNKDERYCSTLGSSPIRGEGRLSVNTKTHIQHLVIDLLLDKAMAGEENKETVSTPHICHCALRVSVQYLKTTPSSATANYPALGIGSGKKTYLRTMKRAWLVAHAVSKCYQIVIFSEYTAGLPLNIALLFTALILYVTTTYPPMRWSLDTTKIKAHPKSVNLQCSTL